MELTVHDLDELLAIRALDALDPEERRAVDRLVECDPVARARLDLFREAAALLAGPPVPPPRDLWHRIARSLHA
ncbi:MAG: hypothetical protein M5U14_11615 [Acidimicrobiia bacterium]|nr:hypothetical protein [Acidimicrobiia bacterium]